MSELQDNSETDATLRALLARGAGRVHLIGVCGVGMAGLAFHLKQAGFEVSGCDAAPNALAGWLAERGIAVVGGHDAAHAAAADWLIRTTAAPETHPEVAAARAAGRPVFRRGQTLAALLERAPSTIVCGTHGKTTTTAMIAQILRDAGQAAAFCIGGETPALGGVAGGAAGAHMVAEADESDGTLARYRPDVAVVTNIEFDHAEHFADTDALLACFRALAERVTRRLIYCADDPLAARVCAAYPLARAYGFSAAADVRARLVEETADGTRFRVSLGPSEWGELRLPVGGRHHVLNALAACAVAAEWGVAPETVRASLARFAPARRRFERIIERDDILVVSDYAHHPTEIAATLRVARGLRRRRLLAVFQPHRYSRTRALGAVFPAAFEGVDELVLTPVYAASEPSVRGGTSADLYAHFRRAGRPRACCASSLPQAWAYLRAHLQPGDGLLVLGAGDVERVAEWAKTELAARGAAGLNPAVRWAEAVRALPLRQTGVRTDEPMARKTTLRVGGAADIFLSVGAEDELAAIVRWARDAAAPVTVLGAGSNVWVSDLGVRGVVVRLVGPAWRGIRPLGEGRFAVGAALALDRLTAWLAERGWEGVEFLRGIPGSVGGAVRMNAGAWHQTIGERVMEARVMAPDGVVHTLTPAALAFDYRSSGVPRGHLVLEVTLALRPGDPARLRQRLRDIEARRGWMRGLRSAGSVFRNPPGDYAGRLIEQAGLKGWRVGGAAIAAAHANVIVTERGARASDVWALKDIVRDEIRTRTGVALTEEMVCLE